MREETDTEKVRRLASSLVGEIAGRELVRENPLAAISRKQFKDWYDGLNWFEKFLYKIKLKKPLS